MRKGHVLEQSHGVGNLIAAFTQLCRHSASPVHGPCHSFDDCFSSTCIAFCFAGLILWAWHGGDVLLTASVRARADQNFFGMKWRPDQNTKGFNNSIHRDFLARLGRLAPLRRIGITTIFGRACRRALSSFRMCCLVSHCSSRLIFQRAGYWIPELDMHSKPRRNGCCIACRCSMCFGMMPYTSVIMAFEIRLSVACIDLFLASCFRHCRAHPRGSYLCVCLGFCFTDWAH